MNNNVFVKKCIVIIMVKQRLKITRAMYKGRFDVSSSIIGNKYAMTSWRKQMPLLRGHYAALKNMYGDQPNKTDSHKAFKKADGQLTQSPEETLAVMELHTRILLNHPGSANLSDVNRYLPPQAEILQFRMFKEI